VAEFNQRGRSLFMKIGRITVAIGVGLFCFGDVLTNSIFSLPSQTLISSVRGGTFSFGNLLLPLIFLCAALALGWVFYNNYGFKNLLRKTLANSSDLVNRENEYRRNLWNKMQGKITDLISNSKATDIWIRHSGNLTKIQRFLEVDLKKYYDKLRS